ncbi:MAG TPA: hypothetical protein VKB49_24085 [Candidatus Sulfotelmatobacter sp.]|nr:hypothetical protein [Candidatus Sulfotelmatobacter sp.]
MGVKLADARFVDRRMRVDGLMRVVYAINNGPDWDKRTNDEWRDHYTATRSLKSK